MGLKSLFKLLYQSKVSIMFLLGLAFSLYGFNQYWSGYHDLDMAQNMIFLRDDIQFELWQNNIPFTLGTYGETTTGGYQISSEQLYYNGVIRLKQSIPWIILGFITLGYGLGRIRQ